VKGVGARGGWELTRVGFSIGKKKDRISATIETNEAFERSGEKSCLIAFQYRNGGKSCQDGFPR
jgi:hypothetical protein